MTYEEARAFIEETKAYGSVLGLTSIRRLMKELGNVQEQLNVIHVAGTNGKGSTCTMIASILQKAGYQVGRYSSPAVFSFEEIYQLNGIPITKEDFAYYTQRVQNACQQIVQLGLPHPTIFEVETAIAFCYFAEKRCDILVLETGMGGATDATNLITRPVCSVLTSISMDHMGFLGDTLERIAAVKAGIIKRGCPVVSLLQKPEAMAVIEEQANEAGSMLRVADPSLASHVSYDADGMQFEYPTVGNIQIQLTGACQLENAVVAIDTALTLMHAGYHIDIDDIVEGMQQAYWPGRFETIQKNPRVIIDGAHNEDAAKKLLETIENCFTNTPITYIIGVLADKEHEKMLKLLLPHARKVYTITPDNPRALEGIKLCQEAEKYHSDVHNELSVKNAVDHALSDGLPGEVVLAFGSLSYLSQVREAVSDRM